MTRANVAPTVGFVVVVIAYAGLASTWVNADPGWYESLPRPAWQPPPWVFGVMWPLNFLALLVAGVGVGTQRPAGQAWTTLGVLAGSVAFALGWAYLFYVPHALAGAALSLAAAAVTTWALVVLVVRLLPWAGIVLIPYACWLTIATSLAVGYWRQS